MRKRSQSQQKKQQQQLPSESLQEKIKAKDMKIMELMKEVTHLKEQLIEHEKTIASQKRVIKKQSEEIEQLMM